MHGRERRVVIVRPALSAAAAATLANADEGAVGAITGARSVRRNTGASSIRPSIRRAVRYGECSLAFDVLYEPEV